ncbi:MAG: hypothetical protein Q9166_005840 [cf. Caloplaca sp. 2 TL-2023]
MLVPYYVLLFCIFSISRQAIATDTHATLSLNPPRSNASLTTFPRLPDFEMSFTFDQGKPLRVLEVYQTAIQLMYEFAQRAWDEPVQAMVVKQIEGYDVLMMFLNPSNQLKVGHCVAALYRAVAVMTDGVIFCQLRCHLLIHGGKIGALSIAPVKDDVFSAGTGVNVTDASNVTGMDISAVGVGVDSGTIRDADNPHFSITFRFLGKAINQKEVSMGVLEAMASAAPFAKNAACRELEVVSPDGGCAIIIESVSNRLTFTYGWATKALKLMYQRIVVPNKRFGDIYLELKYDDHKFGELRMLRITEARNSTEKVAIER